MNRIVTASLLSLLAVSTHAAEVIFSDDFKGGLAGGWTWIREDRSAWRVSSDGLEVRMLPGNMWGGANNAKNVLVRPAPDPAKEPIEVSIVATNQPTAQYEQVDLVWYYDDSNMVKIGEELVDGKLSIVMGREQNDRTRTIAIIPLDSFTVRLRLLVAGDKIRGQFRTAKDQSWRDAGECDLPVKGAPKVSLQFYQGPPAIERWARVNEFRILRQAR